VDAAPSLKIQFREARYGHLFAQGGNPCEIKAEARLPCKKALPEDAL
jgi:hypothetical protein